jgi:septal ring factor EnvC (AmiA/AmiB activator)
MYLIGLVNNFFNKKFLVYFLCVIIQWLHGQKRVELENKKKQTIAIIQETNKILEETRTKKKVTIGQLNAINSKIYAKSVLIEELENEIKLLDEEIDELNNVIFAMENDLSELKKEYAAMIYTSFKFSRKLDKSMFLLASSSFTQFSMRLKYLQHYSDSRKEQIKLIKQTKNQLLIQKRKLEEKKITKEKVFFELLNEKKELDLLKIEHKNIVKELTRQEKSLKTKLDEYKKSLAKLEILIADIVRKEIEESKRKANELKKKDPVTKNTITLTPEAKLLSENFESNKSKLLWPVKYGFISQHFGKSTHPILKHVTVENLGIDIQTNKNEKVRSVFKGKVSAVASVPGMNQVIMIQHGDYFTVYAKLKNVLVKKGDEVETGQEIGEVFTDLDEVTELQFQIWKNNERLNPEEWIIPKK